MMRSFTLILFLCASQLCFSQTNQEKDTSLNTCTLVFFSRFHPELREIRIYKYPVFVNDSLVGRVGQNRYIVVKTTPGKKIIAPQMDGKKLRKGSRKIEVVMEAGDTRYYEIIDAMPPISFHLTLIEASGKFGKEQVEHLKIEKTIYGYADIISAIEQQKQSFLEKSTIQATPGKSGYPETICLWHRGPYENIPGVKTHQHVEGRRMAGLHTIKKRNA